MGDDPRRWRNGVAESTLRTIGIEMGQTVLDFGCGEGWYSIPISIIVGPDGTVYALDRDRSELDILSSRMFSQNIDNCKIIHSKGERIDLPDDHLDVVLLFDVLHYYYFSDESDRRSLLREIKRVLNPNGFLSLYPKHLESWSDPNMDQVERELEEEDFWLAESKRVTMIHEEVLEKSTIMNYRIL